VDRAFGLRKAEYQPALPDINVGQHQDVAEEGPVGAGICTVDDDVGTGNHRAPHSLVKSGQQTGSALTEVNPYQALKTYTLATLLILPSWKYTLNFLKQFSHRIRFDPLSLNGVGFRLNVWSPSL